MAESRERLAAFFKGKREEGVQFYLSRERLDRLQAGYKGAKRFEFVPVRKARLVAYPGN